MNLRVAPKGNQVCRTLAPIQPEEICETWIKTGAKQATTYRILPACLTAARLSLTRVCMRRERHESITPLSAGSP